MPTVAPRPQRSARRTRLAVALVVVAVAAGCADDSGGDAERFCGEVAANKDALTNPVLTYSDDIEPLLDLYREIGDLAPLAVEDDWDQIVAAYETASTVVPGEPASEQEALAAIYSSEESAAAVDQWLTRQLRRRHRARVHDRAAHPGDGAPTDNARHHHPPAVTRQVISPRRRMTLSTRPYTWASSAVNQRSRSESAWICSRVWPECSEISVAMRSLV